MAICGYCKDRREVKELHGLGIKPCPKCVGADKDDLTAKSKTQRQRSFTPASRPQRMKVEREGVCRNCGADPRIVPLDPAHVTDRALGGCDDPLCTISLCRVCHSRRDGGQGLDLLALLTFDEQAHAVSHVGALSFLHQATGERYVPERKAAA